MDRLETAHKPIQKTHHLHLKKQTPHHTPTQPTQPLNLHLTPHSQNLKHKYRKTHQKTLTIHSKSESIKTATKLQPHSPKINKQTKLTKPHPSKIPKHNQTHNTNPHHLTPLNGRRFLQEGSNPDLLYELGNPAGDGDRGGTRCLRQLCCRKCYAFMTGAIANPAFRPPSVWRGLDTMCGLMARPYHRRRAVAPATDRRGEPGSNFLGLIEAMLWTMAEPLLATQLDAPRAPLENEFQAARPHSVYRLARRDEVISNRCQE